VGELRERAKPKKRLSGSQLVGFGIIAAIVVAVIIGALNGFGRF
jgi:hypothetical protein